MLIPLLVWSITSPSAVYVAALKPPEGLVVVGFFTKSRLKPNLPAAYSRFSSPAVVLNTCPCILQARFVSYPVTGWAQVNGRDELDLTEKVNLDVQYLQKQSTGFDFYILFLTVLKVFRREGVSH